MTRAKSADLIPVDLRAIAAQFGKDITPQKIDAALKTRSSKDPPYTPAGYKKLERLRSIVKGSPKTAPAQGLKPGTRDLGEENRARLANTIHQWERQLQLNQIPLGNEAQLADKRQEAARTLAAMQAHLKEQLQGYSGPRTDAIRDAWAKVLVDNGELLMKETNWFNDKGSMIAKVKVECDRISYVLYPELSTWLVTKSELLQEALRTLETKTLPKLICQAFTLREQAMPAAAENTPVTMKWLDAYKKDSDAMRSAVTSEILELREEFSRVLKDAPTPYRNSIVSMYNKWIEVLANGYVIKYDPSSMPFDQLPDEHLFNKSHIAKFKL